MEEMFKKAEGMLYGYYQDKRDIETLHISLTNLQKSMERIQKDIKNTNVILEDNIKAIAYDKPSIQSSSDGSSQAERDMIRQIEMLEKELAITNRRVLKTKARIEQIESRNAHIENVLETFNEEARRFIEYKYGDEESILYISNRLNMALATAKRKRKEIVNKFTDLCVFCKCVS